MLEARHCSRCNKDKPADQFCSSTRNNWCKKCMSEYLRAYRSPRLEFDATILSDDDIEKEMKHRVKINHKGVNALGDFKEAFESLCKNIKSFNPKPIIKKTRYNNNTKYINSLLNN